MSLLEFRNVSKAFYADKSKTTMTVALDKVDLSIDEGEFVTLVGPSGCGKTVSLSMMAGFDQPTLGNVLYDGRPIEGPGPERGVVFQEYSLFPWQTVQQNIIFAMRNSAKTTGLSGDFQTQALDALEMVGLRDAANKRPNTLSGGMKQRVAIARLLAMDSKVFLMDEPFSALDEQTRSVLDSGLRELWRERNKTIVFVTHSITEAVLLSSRIVMFSESPGRILREWYVPDDLNRDLSDAAFQQLVDEIRSYLPISSATF